MASVSCDICFEDFSELERVPKMLDCGHTFCSVCLDVLLFRICPTCKKELTKTTEEYPTNFIILNLKEISTKKSYPISHIVNSLEKMKELYALRRKMMIKCIQERTDLKILIANNMIKIQQMLEMDQDVLNSTEEGIIVELEATLAKVDEVLFCCKKMDIKPTYALSKYINTACFLCELVNRLHEEEKIYVYERVDGKPKYGRVSLSKDVINFHVLDLHKVDKLSSVVSLQDVRKCVTKDNLQSFFKIGNDRLCFSITNLSFLAFMFVRLCTGETGRKIKGVSSSFMWEKQLIIGPHDRYDILQRNYNLEFGHIRIGNFMLNEVEVESFDDYDVSIITANNETTFSEGDFILQMLERGVCNIIKLSSTTGLTFKNAVGKMIGSFPAGSFSVGSFPAGSFPAGLQKVENVETGEITDSGISLMYSRIS